MWKSSSAKLYSLCINSKATEIHKKSTQRLLNLKVFWIASQNMSLERKSLGFFNKIVIEGGIFKLSRATNVFLWIFNLSLYQVFYIQSSINLNVFAGHKKLLDSKTLTNSSCALIYSGINDPATSLDLYRLCLELPNADLHLDGKKTCCKDFSNILTWQYFSILSFANFSRDPSIKSTVVLRSKGEMRLKDFSNRFLSSCCWAELVSCSWVMHSIVLAK